MSKGPFEENTIVVGDCLKIMSQMPRGCVDAIVTDPPYGLEFMGKEWDRFGACAEPLKERGEGCWVDKGFKNRVRYGSKDGMQTYQSWTTSWATEAYRILKPGAYMLVMGGTRTHHRLGCGLEDAGFEIRDELCWIYASGFPKNYDVSKGIDKRNRRTQETYRSFAEYLKEKREAKGLSMAEIDRMLGTNTAYSWWEGRSSGIQLPNKEHYLRLRTILELDNRFDELIERAEAEREVIGIYIAPDGKDRGTYKGQYKHNWTGEIDPRITAPNLPEAQYWEGYGTSLKPAHESIWLCKKPNEGTYVDNVLKHGCGAMNIDAARTPLIGVEEHKTGGTSHLGDRVYGQYDNVEKLTGDGPMRYSKKGRWPANVLVDCYPEEFIGGVVIEGEGKPTKPHPVRSNIEQYEGYGNITQKHGEIINYPEDNLGNGLLGPYTRFFVIPKPSKAEKTAGGKVENKHVTVKPVRLGKWLIKLIAPHQHPIVMVEPFCGSGAFLRGMQELNYEEGYQITFLGIDKDEASVKTARALLEEDRAGRQLVLL